MREANRHAQRLAGGDITALDRVPLRQQQAVVVDERPLAREPIAGWNGLLGAGVLTRPPQCRRQCRLPSCRTSGVDKGKISLFGWVNNSDGKHWVPPSESRACRDHVMDSGHACRRAQGMQPRLPEQHAIPRVLGKRSCERYVLRRYRGQGHGGRSERAEPLYSIISHGRGAMSCTAH